MVSRVPDGACAYGRVSYLDQQWLREKTILLESSALMVLMVSAVVNVIVVVVKWLHVVLE